MGIEAIGEHLTDAGIRFNFEPRLIPTRIVLEPHNGIHLSVCLSDGDIYLEDITKVAGYKPLTQIHLADPDSFDKLLEAINDIFGVCK